MNYVLNSVIVSVVFFIFKFIEMRFINKEARPIKDLVKDTLVVFIASMISGYLMDQFKLGSLIDNVKEIPKVFTNEPGF